MRILCGTDLLPKSDSALDRAGLLAERLGAKLSLVHAVPGAEPDYLLEREMERARGHLRLLATPPRWRHGPAPAVDVRTGSPVQVLVAMARELDPVLVVLGAHRRRFARDAVAGTIAERVLKRIDCPVLVVRRMPWRGYCSVLLILDCAGSEEVVHAAGELMLDGGADAAVAHAHDPFCAGVAATPGAQPELTALAAGCRLASHGSDAARLALAHELTIATDGVRRGAKRLRPDLLVVGAGGRGWLRRTLLGDVVGRALAMRGSDVLIVPRRRACAAPPRTRPPRGPAVWPFGLRGPDAAA